MQQAVVQQRSFAAAAGSRRACAMRSVAGNGAHPVVAKLQVGDKIRVKADVKVYHVAKFKEGLELKGREATVVQPDVRDYKHHDGKQHELSANLPVKVQFMVAAPDGGKDIKVLAHLEEDELEMA